MTLKPGLVFEVMASAYRHDVLDKYMSLSGDALEGVMKDTGLQIGDLVNRLDETQERTVMRMDALLARSGTMLRLAANDRMMAMVSRLMDLKAVRRVIIAAMRRSLVMAVSGRTPSLAKGDTSCAGPGALGEGRCER
jgi:hypothetical protein